MNTPIKVLDFLPGDTIPTFVIGDVHGRGDLLEVLLEEIETAGRRRIVFLGDLIDRGPETSRVLKIVDEELSRGVGSAVVMGNHEELLFRFVDEPEDPAKYSEWMMNGGDATLRSLGVDPREARTEIAHTILQRKEIASLREAADCITMGKLLFVHAGIRPGVSLTAQTKYDLHWIRQPFLSSRERFDRLVVHGHSPTRFAVPEVHSNRINLDTGAASTGVLCALGISPDQSEMLFLATDETNGTITVGPCDPAEFG